MAVLNRHVLLSLWTYRGVYFSTAESGDIADLPSGEWTVRNTELLKICLHLHRQMGHDHPTAVQNEIP